MRSNVRPPRPAARRPVRGRATDRLYRDVVEDLTELVSRFRPDGTFTYVNEVFCRFFGKKAAEVLGTKWQGAAVAEDLAGIEAQLERLSPQHSVAVVENRVYSGTGEMRWMQFVNRGRFDRRGRLVEVQAVGRDITTLKQAEEALRANEERFRLALAAVPIVVFNQDTALRYTWIGNPALGVSADLAMGRTDEEIIGGETAAPLTAIKRHALETGQRQRGLVRVQYQDRAGLFELVAEPLRDRAGQIQGITGVALDITGIAETQRALRDSEARFAKIFQASPQPIGISRLRDGTFVDVNEAFARLHGYRRDEIVGRTSNELRLWHSRNRDAVFQVLREQRSAQMVEMQGRRRNGEVIDLLASIEWMELDGEPCALGILVDITEQKRVAAELEASQRTLRALTSRLEEVREEERRKLARDIHDTFGHALTDWKFDLSWLDREMEKRGWNRADAVRKRLAGMARRVETEMDATRRMAAALRPPLLDTLGLVPALASLVDEFQKRTGLACCLSRTPRRLNLRDPLAVVIYRIAQELLTNVARHAQARSVELRLASGKGWITFQVRDDGCGIVDDAVVRPTSLGLLGIRERVAPLGGQFQIRSRAGRGTTVIVRLPFPETSTPRPRRSND